MSRTTKAIVLIVLILAGMLLITFVTPAIKSFAGDLAKQSKLPIWIVGLAAPILFVFNRVGRFLNVLFGAGSTERSIRDTNEQLKAKLDEVEQSVQRLDAWRRSEIEPRLRRIDELQGTVAAMQGRAADLSAGVPGMVADQAALVADRDRLQRQLDEVRRAAHTPD